MRIRQPSVWLGKPAHSEVEPYKYGPGWLAEPKYGWYLGGHEIYFGKEKE
jgi:hypothetical protein